MEMWQQAKALMALHPGWSALAIAVLIPLLGACAVFLAPFALLGGVGFIIFTNFGPGAAAKVRYCADATSTLELPDLKIFCTLFACCCCHISIAGCVTGAARCRSPSTRCVCACS
jgi:hypothetical protein